MRKAKIILSVLCLIAGITACSQEDDSFLNLQNIDGEINILGSDGNLAIHTELKLLKIWKICIMD